MSGLPDSELGERLALTEQRLQAVTDALHASSSELQRHQKWVAQAQQLGHFGSWEWDIASDQVVWSSELYRIYGLPPGQFEGTFQGYLNLLHADDQPRVQAHLESALANGQAFEFEERIVRADGSQRTLYSRGLVEVDASQRPIRMLGVCQDLTEQRALECALERERAAARNLESQQRQILVTIAQQAALADSLAAITNCYEQRFPEAFCAVQLLSADGSLLRLGAGGSLPHAYTQAVLEIPVAANAGSCGAAAWRGERVVVADIQHDPLWRNYAQLALRFGLRACWSTPVRGNDGRMVATFAVYYQSVRSPSQLELHTIDDLAALAGVAIEHAGAATERNALIEQLQQTLADLANRNRELQDFAFVASHDLQEPLRKIRTFSDRLLADETTQLNARARDYLERSGAAAARMQTLIDDLLAYTRIASRGRAFRRIKLRELVLTVLDDLESSLEKSGGRIEFGELGELDGDNTQLRQLFQNLLSNALKFHHPDRAPLVQVSAGLATAANGKPAWQITVADNGIGFDPEFAERIFAPFTRLHGRHEYPGTGIGLAIVRRIVERHLGQITARGQPGVGASFTMLFPQPS